MTSPTLSGIQANGATTGTTLDLPKPAGLTNGKSVLLCVRAQGTSAGELTTIPAGFSRIGSPQGAADRAQGFFLKRITDAGSEPANYTLGGWSTGRSVGFSAIVNDLDPTTAVAGFAPYSTGDLAAYVGDAPMLVLGAWGDERTDTRSHVPSSIPTGFTLAANAQSSLDSSSTGSRTGLALVSKAVGDAGSDNVDAAALVWPGGVSANRAISVALRGAAAPASPTLPFSNVAHFLSTVGATCAWRLGGGPFPQHSEYAAQQSDLLGYKAMEFSCGWTSDLVPFGLGPQYLDSIAGVSGNVDPTTMTWATLSSTYQIQNNPVSPGVYQPFYRLVDFLQDYSSTHICLVDPKFGFDTIAKIDAMLAICDANGGPSRIIIKFDSPTGATNLVNRAHAKGYTCINYWGTDTTTLAAQQANWDCLGVLYSADPSVFTAAKSYGKPVWGAVIPDQAGYNAALTNGATFMNISGVQAVAPVGASSTPTPDPTTYAAKDSGSLEIAWLRKVSGISGAATINDLRRAVYGDSQRTYWASRSGLSAGSLSDHKLAAMKLDTGLTSGTLTDVARAYWAKNG